MPKTNSRPGRRSRLAGALAVLLVVAALTGCALLGGPRHLDDEDLALISTRVSDAQSGFDALVRAQSATCEGLCQHVSVDLSPRVLDYTALDIGLAIHETDVALEEQQISSFDYCFDWRNWPEAEVHYLDARLSEVRGLGYDGVFRNAEEQRPTDNCYSFASLSGAEQLGEFLAENGVGED